MLSPGLAGQERKKKKVDTLRKTFFSLLHETRFLTVFLIIAELLFSAQIIHLSIRQVS